VNRGTGGLFDPCSFVPEPFGAPELPAVAELEGGLDDGPDEEVRPPEVADVFESDDAWLRPSDCSELAAIAASDAAFASRATPDSFPAGCSSPVA
jgi:hypothetical protein